jgi:hypothetical protein
MALPCVESDQHNLSANKLGTALLLTQTNHTFSAYMHTCACRSHPLQLIDHARAGDNDTTDQ